MRVEKSLVAMMLLAGPLGAGSLWAGDAKAPPWAAWDKGPSTIDVSSYPPEQQDNYKLFSARCARCHTLARPINAPFTPSEMAAYVKKMQRKPGSGINGKAAQKIIDFLSFNYAARKKKIAKKDGEAKKGRTAQAAGPAGSGEKAD
jgi:hypothetical protein